MSSAERPSHAPRRGSLRAAGICLAAIAFTVSACVTVSQAPARDGAGGSPGTSAVPLGSDQPGSRPSATPALRTVAPDATLEPVGAEVFGFLPYWSLEAAAESIDPDLVDTVAWLGVEAGGDGRLVRDKPGGPVPPGWEGFESQAFRDLQARLQEEGVRVVLAVQRFGWSEGTAERTENLLTNADARDRLARQIAALVDERDLDGVNLDFEPMPESLSDEYVRLVREVRAALDAIEPELHLSVDVHSSLSGYDLPALTADDAADVAVLMGYEYRGAATEGTGSQAPLDDASGNDLRTTVREALATVSGDQLILGLPWYGRAWSTETAEAGSPVVIGEGIEGSATVLYVDAVERAETSGRAYEPGQVSAWTAYPSQTCPTCPMTWRQVWYDDADTFGTKMDFALGEGLAGVGIWALGFEGDRPELWWALRERLQPRPDDVAPNGSASLDPTASVGERSGLTVVEGSAPVLAFAADEQGGSGLLFVRVSLAPDVGDDGALVAGRTFPATRRVEIPLGDAAIGGTSEPGPREIHVQWRDLAGNWSVPLVLPVFAVDPAPAPAP